MNSGVLAMASTADEQNLEAPVSVEETDYEQLIDDYSHFAPPHDGELLQGRVVKLHENDVIVDFGYKSELLVPIEQFIQPDGVIHIRTGVVVSRKMAVEEEQSVRTSAEL